MTSAAAIGIGGLYSAHGEWLRRWLGRQTRCPQRASDIAQDTFCRLLERGLPAIPQDARNYLATVARRILIDDIRRRDLERAYLDAVAQSHEAADTLTPERIAEAVEMLDGVLRLLSSLPDEVRDAFLLRRLDGLGHAEIAETLRISERTVKRHVARAYACCYALVYADS